MVQRITGPLGFRCRKVRVHSCRPLWCDLGRRINPKVCTIYIRQTKLVGQLYRACQENVTNQEEHTSGRKASQILS